MLARAIAGGHLRLDHGDLLEPGWHVYVQTVIDELRQQEMTRYLELSVQRTWTFLPNVKDQQFKEKMLQAENDDFEKLTERYTGYVAPSKSTVAANSKSLWEQEFGDLNSPETKAKIEATIMAMQAGSAK